MCCDRSEEDRVIITRAFRSNTLRSICAKRSRAHHARASQRSIVRDCETIDATIAELATDWRLDRLSITDRNILRLALWELGSGEPPAVVVNEAVEIAGQYGGAESAKFVNGVLGGWLQRAEDGNREDGGS